MFLRRNLCTYQLSFHSIPAHYIYAQAVSHECVLHFQLQPWYCASFTQIFFGVYDITYFNLKLLMWAIDENKTYRPTIYRAFESPKGVNIYYLGYIFIHKITSDICEKISRKFNHEIINYTKTPCFGIWLSATPGLLPIRKCIKMMKTRKCHTCNTTIVRLQQIPTSFITCTKPNNRQGLSAIHKLWTRCRSNFLVIEIHPVASAPRHIPKSHTYDNYTHAGIHKLW